MNGVSSRSHPELQPEVGMSLPHVIEATGAELPRATYVGAFSAALVAGDCLAEGPQRAHCKKAQYPGATHFCGCVFAIRGWSEDVVDDSSCVNECLYR